MQEKFFGGRKGSSPPRVLILGLGVQGGGVGAARFFARLGMNVTVTDLKQKKDLSVSLKRLRGLPIRYVLGKHRMVDIRKSDLIVKNPGVLARSPFIREAKKRKIPITNDAGLFLALAPPETIIGVTGTKGKTTMTMLLGHILGRRAAVVGTPGVSFFEYFFLKEEPEWVIGEFSSFDLEYVRSSPHIAVMTSLFADHLNRYASFDEYARFKMNIARFQNSSDFFIAYRSPRLRAHLTGLKSKVMFTREQNLSRRITQVSWRLPLELVAITYRVSKILEIPEKIFWAKVKNFKVPEGRLEIVARKKGRVYINDTTATNPGSAIHSLRAIRRAFGEKIRLLVITGGEDKLFPKDEIRQYAKDLQARADSVYMLPGSMTNTLAHYVRGGVLCGSLEEAVSKASGTKGIIALVPGAASFNMFMNEFHRARVFIKAVRRLKI